MPACSGAWGGQVVGQGRDSGWQGFHRCVGACCCMAGCVLIVIVTHSLKDKGIYEQLSLPKDNTACYIEMFDDKFHGFFVKNRVHAS